MQNNFKTDIATCLQVLKSGGVILYPTDTIWGLGCDACNTEAVKKIFKIKGRSESKSMIILLPDEKELKHYTSIDKALDKLELKKPVTIIYPGAKNIATNLIAADGTIGIRIPNDNFCQALLHAFGKPIVSTSANISGSVSPKVFKEISEVIKVRADYIVNYRQDDEKISAPSAIIKWTEKGWEIIRD